jgi:hypothetical protein
MFWSEYYPGGHSQPLTKIQYEYMRKWKNSNFIKDWHGPPKPSKLITSHGLDARLWSIAWRCTLSRH